MLPISNPTAGGYSASSSASGKSSLDGNSISSGGSGAGNRGFTLNFAAPGSTLSASADINPPMFGSAGVPQSFLWAAIALAAFVVFKRYR